MRQNAQGEKYYKAQGISTSVKSKFGCDHLRPYEKSVNKDINKNQCDDIKMNKFILFNQVGFDLIVLILFFIKVL